MTRKLLTMAAVLVTLGLTVAAQRGPNGGPLRGRPQPPPPGQGGRGGGRGGPDPVLEIERALNLTTTQAERLRGLLDLRAQADQRAQDDVQAKIDNLVAAQDKPAPSADEVARATQALRDAERAQQSVNEKFQADFRALLTDEQRQTLDRITAAAISADALTRLGVIDGPPRGPGQGGGGRGPGGPPPPPGGQGPRGPQGRALVPATPEQVALGKRLFLDKQLSADGSTSCGTCHDAARAFADGRPVARGVRGIEGTRNSPALVNVAFSDAYFWDGRALTLEHQVLGPITNPRELGLTLPEMERRTGMKAPDVAVALAGYVRTIRSSGSRFDAYRAGQVNALTAQEQAGLAIFRRAGCATCHGGPDFTDNRFHNTGISWRDGRIADEGRFAVTQNPRDHGAFKTPTLREIAITGPYMHDGSVKTLDEVVDFYAKGGRRNPYLDPRVRPLGLTGDEKKALVAFMQTLTGRVTDGL